MPENSSYYMQDLFNQQPYKEPGAWNQFWKGSPSQFFKTPNVTPEQFKIISQLGQMGLGTLQRENVGQPFNFEPYEQRARQQFATQTSPTLSQRFASTLQGAGRANNPQFGDYLGRAASDLESQLANLRAQYDWQSQERERSHGLNLLGLGLRPTFDQNYVPGQAPGYQSLLGDLGKNISSYFGARSLYGGGNNQAQGQSPFAQFSPNYSAPRLGGVQAPSYQNQGSLMPDIQNAFLQTNRGI